MFAKLIGLLDYIDEPNIKKIKKAYEFSKLSHDGQFRASGEPYVCHVLATAEIIAKWKLDAVSIISGLLHDTIEDGAVTRKDIEEEFGDEVALLVDGVTKVSHLKLKGTRTDKTIENLRKLILVMAKDLRVVLVKLADRLHNMRTLKYLPETKRKAIARETMEIYAPLAERMGMGEVKGELEDLAFKFLFEKEYQDLLKKSRQEYKKSEEHIKKMKRALLLDLVQKFDIICEIHGRRKHIYSLWKKLGRKSIDGDFSKVHDVVALRILVETKNDCYAALGIVHEHYKPVPNMGISDFIAQPKPNGYRSIHTKVFGPGNRVVEVQIRTYDMHQQAEYGAASHWAYSEAKSKDAGNTKLEAGVSVDENKLEWVKELVRWQEELKDSEKFLEAVKFDALSHRNFVFSPKGDVYDLPSGATPIDFACVIHTDLLWYIKSAKVNGNMVALDHELSSGDVVEILKSKNRILPNKGWLDFVVTQVAKRKIRSVYNLT